MNFLTLTNTFPTAKNKLTELFIYFLNSTWDTLDFLIKSIWIMAPWLWHFDSCSQHGDLLTFCTFHSSLKSRGATQQQWRSVPKLRWTGVSQSQRSLKDSREMWQEPVALVYEASSEKRMQRLLRSAASRQCMEEQHFYHLDRRSPLVIVTHLERDQPESPTGRRSCA